MTNSHIEMDSTGASPKLESDAISTEDVSVVSAFRQDKGDEEQQAEAVPNKNDLEIVSLSESEVPPKEVIRVLLWTAPRSLSTAFERCMTRVPNAKIFNEMYGAAFLLGPNRKVRWYPKLTPKHSYQHCKNRMEAEHTGHDFVFAKDFVFEMHHHTDMLPKGYKHTFLIRHPYKVFTSLRTMLCRSVVLKWLSLGARIKMCFPTDGYFFEDMWELYTYIKEHPDYPDPIIIDADDLIRDPDAMIMKYCEMIGLPFNPDILKWEKAELKELPWEGPKFFHFMNKLIGCYTNALNSTGFRKGGFKKESKVGKSDVKSKGKKSNTSNKVDATDKVVMTDATNATTDEAVATADGHHNEAFTKERASKTESKEKESSSKDGACSSTVTEYDLSSLNSDVRKAIEHTMPFYKLLHARRITLDN